MRRVQVVDLGLHHVRAGQLLVGVVHAGRPPAFSDEPVEVEVGTDRRLAVDDEVELDGLDRDHRHEHADQRDLQESLHSRTSHRLYAQYTPIPMTATPTAMSAFHPQPMRPWWTAARPHSAITNGTESRK